MDNKQDLLRKYRKNVELVNYNQIEMLSEDEIPAKWLNVVKEKDERKKIEKALEIWENFVSVDLRNTIFI
ncbi:hypothetical protein BCJMU51_3190 [Bacillus cereus]|nr:hypothetical protein BCJMU51_3190 [Bacillus cereus]BCD18416.1 hypothetical protein BC30077_3192 [Bacillus cereus]